MVAMVDEIGEVFTWDDVDDAKNAYFESLGQSCILAGHYQNANGQNVTIMFYICGGETKGGLG